jgi:hypothetical protein
LKAELALKYRALAGGAPGAFRLYDSLKPLVATRIDMMDEIEEVGLYVYLYFLIC